MRDVVQAGRAIGRMPVMALVVIVSLAAGIAANTIVFSFVQARVLRPLPGVVDATEFTLIEPRGETGTYPGASWLEYRDLATRLRAFEEVLAFRIQALTVGEAGRAERASGLLVSGNYFTALGIQPAAGRLIGDDDARPAGGEAVVVISYEYWRDRFAASGEAIGQSLRVNGQPLTIIGVTPAAFRGTVIGMRFDLWVPATLAPRLLNGSRELEERSARGYQVAGRLAEDATVAEARTELATAMRDLALAHPESNGGFSAEVLAFWDAPRGPQRMLVRALAILQSIMIALLLAVCGNTAMMLVARASTRQHEAGVHLALGARPAQVFRLLLVESLLLAACAAAAGAIVAFWAAPAIAAIPLTSGFPVRTEAAVDGAGLLFAALLGVLCAVLAGGVPALQSSRVDPIRALGHGSRTTSRGWVRRVAMGTQAALAVIVLMAAGSFVRSLQDARDIDPGFGRDGVLLGRYDLTDRQTTPSSAREFASRTLERLRELPGVQSVAIAQQVPLDIHGLPLMSFTVDGNPRLDGALDRAISNVVTPGYFATMRIPFVSGSDFVALDDRAADRQVIVNRAFTSRYLAGREPLGRAIVVGGRRYLVRGVVETSVSESFGEAPTPCLYFSYRDRPAPVGQLHVRAAQGTVAASAAGLRSAIAAVDPSLPVYDVRTLAEHIETNLGLRKIPARLFAVIGPLLLALAAIGIYGVVSGAVVQRSGEIGVRLALGATAGRVRRELMGEHLQAVVAGAALGTFGGLLVFLGLGEQPPDPWALGGAPLLLLAVALFATWLPARQLTGFDPSRTLRNP